MTGWRLKAYVCLARNMLESSSTVFILSAFTEYELFAAWKLTKRKNLNKIKQWRWQLAARPDGHNRI